VYVYTAALSSTPEQQLFTTGKTRKTQHDIRNELQLIAQLRSAATASDCFSDCR
jgi:hypothetical protein